MALETAGISPSLIPLHLLWMLEREQQLLKSLLRAGPPESVAALPTPLQDGDSEGQKESLLPRVASVHSRLWRQKQGPCLSPSSCCCTWPAALSPLSFSSLRGLRGIFCCLVWAEMGKSPEHASPLPFTFFFYKKARKENLPVEDPIGHGSLRLPTLSETEIFTSKTFLLSLFYFFLISNKNYE